MAKSVVYPTDLITLASTQAIRARFDYSETRFAANRDACATPKLVSLPPEVHGLLRNSLCGHRRCSRYSETTFAASRDVRATPELTLPPSEAPALRQNYFYCQRWGIVALFYSCPVQPRQTMPASTSENDVAQDPKSALVPHTSVVCRLLVSRLRLGGAGFSLPGQTKCCLEPTASYTAPPARQPSPASPRLWPRRRPSPPRRRPAVYRRGSPPLSTALRDPVSMKPIPVRSSLTSISTDPTKRGGATDAPPLAYRASSG